MTGSRGIDLRAGPPGTSSRPSFADLPQLTEQASATQGLAVSATELARSLTTVVPTPGHGRTAERWSALASVAVGDLSAARVVEAHLDAIAILAESGAAPPDAGTAWGVYAAEGPDQRLEAYEGRTGWRLSGTKPWCSAADCLDGALVTAEADGGRRLFAIDLHDPSVVKQTTGWVSRGLADITSVAIELDGTAGTPIGEPDWYLKRPGFAWGGMGVAACWYGGVVGLARALWAASRHREPDQLALLALGSADLAVESCRLVLADAAAQVDSGHAAGDAGVVLAERVRGVVAAAADTVITTVGHALGPGPLATDEDHARRVADLQVYVRQHHAERDLARLGGLLLGADGWPW